jgi:hypothetical protein
VNPRETYHSSQMSVLHTYHTRKSTDHKQPISVAGGLRRRDAAPLLKGLRLRIPLSTWIFVPFVFLVRGSGICDEQITRSEESYRISVCVCVTGSDLGTSTKKWPRAELSCCATEKKILQRYLSNSRTAALVTQKLFWLHTSRLIR